MDDAASTQDLPTGLGPAFRWGVSTAAYQVEGAVAEGGRGPSVWDTFSHEPGRTHEGDTGDVACDHYHRYAEDVALMSRLGVDTYRFSFAWPRIQPTGRGPANPEGLAFYDRLLDELLAAGVSPCPTLFHWDTPQALEDQGGWLERDITERFADYAAILVEHFGDRVAMWTTVNEPVVVTMLGHALGTHAPGRRLLYGALPVAHHQLLAHGRAVQALRAGGASMIGIASNHTLSWPASERTEDVEAAMLHDILANWLFADPVLLGRYPQGYAELMPGPVADDLEVIGGQLDWFGLNHYFPTMVGAVADTDDLPFSMGTPPGYPETDFGWPVVPDAFEELLLLLHRRYGAALPPVYVTENGCSYGDGPGPDGRVRDDRRIAYLDGYLRSLGRAREAGVDVRGYFQWSLLDNFEWAEGYAQRFGLVHVDYDTQVRTPKDSFAWYADVIAAARAEQA